MHGSTSVSSLSSTSQKNTLGNLSCAFMSKDSTFERVITVAATQMCCTSPEENVKKAESLIRIAASRGAQIVLLQELFHFGYFPIEANSANFRLATALADSSLIRAMSSLAKELRVVLPVSFFERYLNSYYNSCAIIDADGSILGTIRKHHISDRLGYNEKYYFAPSDESFRAFETQYGQIGVAIGSDQWYPEVSRALVIHGAEMLFFTSAMGSSLYDLRYDPRDQWQRVLQGHAAANMVPVIASNRVGTETMDSVQVTFTGSSFITGQTGELLKVADRESEGVLVETFDLEKYQIRRASWGLLRDRRPETYRSLTTRDG
uniref:Ncarbamoylputrescine amidase putative n=1 Tax=Albugo laibachii Nc14 TaxID=890382 RepID=F0W9J5_9STRA|nr:Ncarbamoylputrescine amidase putative [Albugo laibachii Nc14]|eukprot:CCA17809.1 Ncarbamoylputrescine amidase putative [Albugo laibachii Nc14]